MLTSSYSFISKSCSTKCTMNSGISTKLDQSIYICVILCGLLSKLPLVYACLTLFQLSSLYVWKSMILTSHYITNSPIYNIYMDILPYISIVAVYINTQIIHRHSHSVKQNISCS